MSNQIKYGLCIFIVAGLYFFLPYVGTMLSGHTVNVFETVIKILASFVIRMIYMLGLDIFLIILPLAYIFIKGALNKKKAYLYLIFQLVMFIPIAINNWICYRRFLHDFYLGPYNHHNTQRFHITGPNVGFTEFIIYSFKLPIVFLKWLSHSPLYSKEDNIRTLKYYMPGMALRFDLDIILLLICMLFFIYAFLNKKPSSYESN